MNSDPHSRDHIYGHNQRSPSGSQKVHSDPPLARSHAITYTLRHTTQLQKVIILGSKDFVQRMKLDKTLDIHRGCVNSIWWNEQGSLILSGSDDKKLCLTNPYSKEVVASIPTGHRSNIFSAKFLPGTRDRQVISCSGDGCIMYSDIECPELYGKNTFNCHYGTAYEVATLPSDPNTFMSCGEDGTVRWFDLRRKSSCSKEDCKEDVMINCRRAVTGVCVNPVLPYQLAVGCSDSSVRIFDRRMLGTRLTGNHVGRGIQGILCRFCPSHLQNKYSRPTSLSYSANGQDLLVSYASDYIYLFGTNARYEQSSGELLSGGKDDGLVDVDVRAAPSERDQLTAPGNPVKRLRLRGDWSDTGPRARPRSELPEEERPRPTMIQRMSEMLSRWLEDSASRPRPGERSQADSPSSSSSSASSSQHASPSSLQEGSQVDVRARIREFSRSASSSGAGPSTSGPAARAQTDDANAKTGGEKAVGEGKGEESAIVERSGKESDRREEKDSKDTSRKVNEGASSLQTDGKQSDQGQSSEASSSGQRSKFSEEDESSEMQAKMDESKDSPSKKTVSKKDESKKDDREVDEGDRRNEDEKKGIFALGNRMEDRNPQPRLTKQDSLEHARSRKQSVVDAPPTPIEPDVSESSAQSTSSAVGDDGVKGADQAQASGGQAIGMDDEKGDGRREKEKKQQKDGRESDGGDEEGQGKEEAEKMRDDDGDDQTKRGKGKGKGKKERDEANDASASGMKGDGGDEGNQKGATTPTTPSTSTQSSSGRSRSDSSQSMTCSESDSEEEVQLLGAERVKKSPSPKPPDDQTAQQAKLLERKAARQKLRDLFKARKEEEIAIKNVFSPAVEMVYKGHRNSRTMIKEANFWGDHYIISGSDCGHIFFWDRYTAELVMLLEGDKHVVNCIQPHPFDPLLATSGIDYNVKLWSPIATEACLPENAAEVMRINELMLEETRDTITVPPSFMLRMLASINHLRGDRRRSEGPQSTSESSDE